LRNAEKSDKNGAGSVLDEPELGVYTVEPAPPKKSGYISLSPGTRDAPKNLLSSDDPVDDEEGNAPGLESCV